MCYYTGLRSFIHAYYLHRRITDNDRVQTTSTSTVFPFYCPLSIHRYDSVTSLNLLAIQYMNE